MRWTMPLTEARIAQLTKANERNGPVIVIDGPVGPMIKVGPCTNPDRQAVQGRVYYCGGEGGPYLWLDEEAFLQTYPEYDKLKPYLSDPEFDLDDMELAEIIMDELK